MGPGERVIPGRGTASVPIMRELRELFPYQERVLTWVRNRTRAAFFLSMRLGKTIVTVRWAVEHGCRHALVVAPLSVLHGWRNELRKENIRSVTLRGGARDKRLDRAHRVTRSTGYRWAVTTYETVRSHPELLEPAWDLIILDESTKIKNPKAAITKTLLGQPIKKLNENGDGYMARYGVDHIPHRAILSGLPAPESPMDYFCQIKFLRGRFCSYNNFYRWRDAYFAQVGWGWTPKIGALDNIRTNLGTIAYRLTNRAAGLGFRRVTERREAPMSTKQKKFQRSIADEWAVVLPSGELWSTKTKLAVVTALGRIAGGWTPAGQTTEPVQIGDHKIRELVSLLTGELKREQAVVWFRFNAELNAAHAALRDAGVRSVRRITGGTPADKRARYNDRFLAGRVRILLCQIKCAKYGLDLSSSDTVIYYSNGYSMEDRYQSVERVFHPQKKCPVLVLDLVTVGSIDETIIKLLRRKHMTSHAFVNRLMEHWRRK